jgi:hypothetical protein
LISISYISLLLSRQRPRVLFPSSPPLLFRKLPEKLDFRAGTKRHKIGTGEEFVQAEPTFLVFFPGTRGRPRRPARYDFPL